MCGFSTGFSGTALSRRDAETAHRLVPILGVARLFAPSGKSFW